MGTLTCPGMALRVQGTSDYTGIRTSQHTTRTERAMSMTQERRAFKASPGGDSIIKYEWNEAIELDMK